jgi:hypothetical protein
MLHTELTRYVVAHVAVGNQVEIISLYLVVIEIPTHFHPAFGHTADGAAGAVFKDKTGYYTASVNDHFDIIDGIDGMPFHKNRL